MPRSKRALRGLICAAAIYAVILPLLAVVVNAAIGGSDAWEKRAGWLLTLDHRVARHAEACGTVICYRGTISEEGAGQAATLAAGMPIGATLRIHSGGGAVDAMERMMSMVRERDLAVEVRAEHLEEEDCGSACLGVLAAARVRWMEPDARLRIHITRTTTFAPGLVLQAAVEACEQYLAADCQERIARRLYGGWRAVAADHRAQLRHVEALEGEGGRRMSRQLAECRDPDPLETLEGMTFTWDQFLRVRDGFAAIDCDGRKRGG